MIEPGLRGGRASSPQRARPSACRTRERYPRYPPEPAGEPPLRIPNRLGSRAAPRPEKRRVDVAPAPRRWHASPVRTGSARRPSRERGKTHAERLAGRDGYFAPESVIRRVGNSPLVPVLSGGAAVLLQVAHPLVAAGVVAHSDYRSDLWRRLLRTLQALYLIVYGSKEEADRAGAVVQAVHARVHGKTEKRLGVFPAGTPYAASDPDLMLWVHATLVEASLAGCNRFVARLAPPDEERYYREMALVARVFGVPEEAVPATLADFREYVQARLAGPEISVTDPARDVADVILDAPLPAPLRLLAPGHRLATAALLPARVRAEYALTWSPVHAAALAATVRSLRLASAPLFAAAVRLSRAHGLARSGGRPRGEVATGAREARSATSRPGCPRSATRPAGAPR